MKSIDANGKKIGRLASQISLILTGKDNPNFRKERIGNEKVEVINVSKMVIDEKKLAQKEYKRYSGYPGGLKTEKMGDLKKRQGNSRILKIAVYGMLPKNKLRSKMIKNLTIKE